MERAGGSIPVIILLLGYRLSRRHFFNLFGFGSKILRGSGKREADSSPGLRPDSE